LLEAIFASALNPLYYAGLNSIVRWVYALRLLGGPLSATVLEERKMSEHRRSAHAVFDIKYHVVLTTLLIVDVGGREIAIQTARNHGLLRGHGVTIRKTIDAMIATRCIVSGFDLLHNDQDFDTFASYLGISGSESPPILLFECARWPA
jgi:predicted nucleic acid-binding protein